MGQLKRVFRGGRRFLFNRKYRNMVLDLIQRKTEEGTNHTGAVRHDVRQRLSVLRGKRVNVVAGCELTFLVECLQNFGMKVSHTYVNGRGTDPMTEVLMPGSPALSEPWDYYILSAAQILRRLIRRIQLDCVHYLAKEQDKDLAGVLDNCRQAILAIRKRTSVPIFLFSYVLTYIPTFGLHEYRSMKNGRSLIEFWHLFHLRLYELAREFPATYVLDADLALDDMGKTNAINSEASNGMFDHLSWAGAGVLADHFIQHISIIEPELRRIKCAIFDLDGTLWSGVLREDGPGGVVVQEYFLNTMEILASRGIVLGICSKNDPVEAQHLPGLLGKEVCEKIVTCHLSWKAKSQVLKDISEELNLSLENIAFFDDSPFERAEVAANAPAVMVLSPDRIFECPNMPEFQQLGEITSEAVTRASKYQQAQQRRKAEQSSNRLDDFLHSCDLEIDITPATPSDLSRIFELLNRAHQLNATLACPSMHQLKEQLDNSTVYHLLVAHLRDHFGDFGLIGFAAVMKSTDAWQVSELAFSCRAAGRGAEQAMLSNIAAEACADGVNSICIDFHPGPSNQQMLTILQDCGFSPSGTSLVAGKPIRLTRSLHSSDTIKAPEWLTIVSSKGMLT